ncbi:MAG: TonB-dependent receptor [Saprospiraceae bacterium]|nr:TonB-dependent receptor [Saprospiraceae bacterium]
MKVLHVFLLLLFTQVLFSQKISISGKVLDAKNGEPIIGAAIALLQATDSAVVTGEITDVDGNFIIRDVKRRDFILQISYLGYGRLFKNVNSESDIDLKVLNLYESSQVLDEVVVQAEAVTGRQKGDTISYNASAFTTLGDATSRDLITKMPGIVIQNGQVQAEGEAVQKILVDGKEFFGGDINTALQSLPAEIIKSIEIYDRKSEKAQLSGFDDGNEVKTINIVTKPSRKIGQFGKMDGGYGTDGRYQLAASVNFFNDNKRWTVTGLSNNVNITNYSADPNSQGEARTQDGVINTNNIGLQYSNIFFDRLEVSGNYGYSNRKNQASADIFRDYILPSQADQVYEEMNANERNDKDHRFNARLEYRIDKRNRLIFLPRADIKSDINTNSFLGKTSVLENPLNQTTNFVKSNNEDNDFGANLLFNHQFLKTGRTFTLSSNVESHNNIDDANRQAENIFYSDSSTLIENLDQHITRNRGGVDVEFGGSYTEPVGANGTIELEYEFRNRKNDSDKLNFDLGTNREEVLDTSLSNVFDSEYRTHEAELGYQYKVENLSLQVELEYQRADLINNQTFPQVSKLNRNFNSLLPTLRMNYQINESSNLEFNYFTWTREPGIGQLQEVVDNTNPIQLRVGNPNLNQEYNNRMRVRFRNRNAEKESSFFVGMDASIVSNSITNTTFIADETFMVNDQIVLEKGGQLIKPQNVDGNWNARTFINFGLPIKKLKSNFNAWTGVGYRQLPGIINDQETFTRSNDFSLGLNLSSNISDKIDFNISTRSNYSLVKNSLRPELNNNFFRHTSQINFKGILWKGITLRTDVSHQYFGGLADGIDPSYMLINGSIGKKVLKDDRGEISVRVYDLLKQNNNVNRDITEIYIQDSERMVLQRYFMVTFTYNLRHFSTGTSAEDYKIESGNNENNNDRREN